MTSNSIPNSAFKRVYLANQKSNIKYWLYGFCLLMLIILFLPWTQNIKASGTVSTLKQEQRPQKINSSIPGTIIKWWVKEGDFVKKGDTIVKLSEIKEEYLDPNLLTRTEEQVEAKQNVLSSYKSKVNTFDNQLNALAQSKQLKLRQIANKLLQLKSKQIAEESVYEAAQNESALAEDQFLRQQKMFEQGLVSQTQLQQRSIARQQALAKRITSENTLMQIKQEIIITQLEKTAIEQEYLEKISKADGDRYTALGQIATSTGDVSKLKNQLSGYRVRNGMYIILAPQDGQIVQANKAGIGEILKEGESIAIIVPPVVEYAVEIFVRPVDLPLVNVGQSVRLMFDGFPAIVFSGWPSSSYGTFGARVLAVENSISPNGFFRVLVIPDTKDAPWPKLLRVGSGAKSIVLLKNVPVWYELWRNINGFPPDFYIPKKEK